jgi:UDP-glucose 4-epimerase
LKVLKKGRHLEIYNIGTQQETSILTLVKELSNYFRRKIVVIPGKLAKGGTPRRCPDISKIQRFGYTPSVSLSAGLARTVQWYMEHGT